MLQLASDGVTRRDSAQIVNYGSSHTTRLFSSAAVKLGVPSDGRRCQSIPAVMVARALGIVSYEQRDHPVNAVNSLSASQRDVLYYKTRGWTHDAIMARLGISRKTVYNYQQGAVLAVGEKGGYMNVINHEFAAGRLAIVGDLPD